MHRGARGPEVHPVPGKLQVVAGVLPVEHDVAGGVRHRVLDQRAREEKPALGTHPPAGRGDRLDAARDGLGQADPLQHVEGGGMDPLDLALAEGPVPAADHAGAHRAFVLAQRGGPELAPRLPAAHPSSAHRGFAHGASCRRHLAHAPDLRGIEHRGYAGGEAFEQQRRGHPATTEHAMLDVCIVLQREHRNRLVARVGDPVLRNASLGIVRPFLDQITIRVVRAHDLDHQVRAQPVAVLAAGIRTIAEHQQVGFPELALADADPQRGDHDDDAARLEPCAEQVVEVQEDDLMGVGRYG